MALSAFTGSFNIGLGAATTTVAVTGVGFEPKVVIFWWNGRTESTDTVGRATHLRGVGWATSATNRAAVTSRSVDAGASAAADSGHSADACVIETGNTALVGAADLQSFDSDGFTLVIDDQFVTDLRVQYLALGGDSLTNAISGQFTPTGTAPTTQAVTGVGFQPDLVFFLADRSPSLPTGGHNDSDICVGVANGTTGEAVWAGGSDNGDATMQTLAYCRRGECFARFAASVAAIADRAEFTSFDADGFTINWLERTSDAIVSYLALKGLSSVVGDLLTQTDTTTAITESGFGFQPSAALFVSAARAEDAADTPTDHDHWSMGAATSASARSVAAVLDEDNVADSEVTTASEFDAVYANIATDSTIQGLMDLTAFDSDGMSLIMDDADPAQNFVWYLALGPAAGGGGGSRPVLIGGRVVGAGLLRTGLVS